MIENIVLEYLKHNLDTPVYMEEPGGNHEKYIVVEKTGDSGDALLKNAVIAIKSYGVSLYEAAALSKSVRSVMESIICLDNISEVDLNSEYNFTDTSKKKYRYQAVYALVYMD